MLRQVTRTRRRELEDVDEDALVWIAGVEGQHPVVDVLLGALGLVTRSQEPASRVGGPASLQPGGLGVVVLSVTVLLGDVLQDDSPEAFDVYGAADLGVVDVRGAQVALGSDPVGGVIGRGSLGGSGVVAIVERVLLVLGDVLDQVVGALIGHVGVLLQEDGVVTDLGGDLVLGVLGVDEAEGEVGVDGASRGGLGVTVGGWWRRCIGRRRMGV